VSVYEIIKKRRTIRKFKQEKIERALLEKFVDAARVAPSGSNLQPLKYIITDSDDQTEEVFKNVKWAGYIAPHGNPGENEKPVAYIIILADTEIRKTGWERDAGAAMENIILAAAEEGIGTCWIGSINRDELMKYFNIPEKYQIDSLVALGYAAEHPVVEDENGSIKYYKDENGVLHVPKRRLEDVIVQTMPDN